MLVYQAWRFEMDPNNATRSKLASHAGAARFAYNWGLDLVVRHLAARRALVVLAIRSGASRVEAEAWADDLLGRLPWTLPALRRAWNQAKAEVAPWWAENSKESYNSGLDALARALDAWSRSRRGARRGSKVGFPRFKAKSTARRSFRVTTGAFGVVDNRHIRLPRIGVIRTKEPTTKLEAAIGAGTARILSATLSEHAGRWYVAFGVEATRPEHRPPPGPPVGVDVGVGSLAVVSTGEVVPNSQAPLPLCPAHSPSPAPVCPPSRPGQGSGTLQALAAVQDPPRCCSRQAVRCPLRRAAQAHHPPGPTHAVVVVEDLAVAGMTASARGSGNRRGKAGLNRAVLDTAPSEIRRQLTYKSAWYGSRLVVADRWYPSSKTCSRCKAVKAKLPLSERTYRCCHCGLVIDRDLNAAANLASLVETATSTGTASGAGTSTLLRRGSRANAQGEERFMGSPRCSSTNCEDGTGSTPDKTATATRQRVAPKPVLVRGDR